MRDVQAKLGQVVMNDVANKPISPLNVDEVVRVTSKCTIPPFGHKAIHGKVNLVLHGYKMNVMTHGLEKRFLQMWLEVEVRPGLFVPPEDDSYSVNFAMEVINKAYPGCTGMYLDRAGHMLAFYG